VALHRYPVKSLSGEDLDRLAVDDRGVVGDRTWSVRTAEGRIGSGKDTGRFRAVPHLLRARARCADGQVLVALPDGSEHAAGSDRLAQGLGELAGQPLTLAPEAGPSHFDDGPVSLVARASVRAVAEQQGRAVADVRFRPNLVVDGLEAFGEEDWIGRRLRVGTVLLRDEMASERCVMVDQATADLPAQPGNLRAVGRLNRARLGVIARVERGGEVGVGDAVQVDG
jgi:uncharacterized protein YcbX